MIDINWLIKKSGLEGIEFVCGECYGSKTIGGVHIMDNPETYHFFKQGELVITTGYVFKQMRDNEIVEMIKSMNEKGCCGIMFKIHRFYDKVPDFMVKAAEKWNIPILSLPFEIALSDIQMIVLREIFVQERESESAPLKDKSTFFDAFFDENVSRNELKYLCLENRFNTKCRYGILIFDMKDEKNQKSSVQREAFIRNININFYTKNNYLVVAVEIPAYVEDSEVNEFLREYALESSVSMHNIGVIDDHEIANGYIFADASPSFFTSKVDIWISLAYFNSCVFQEVANVICSGLHYSTGQIPKIPFREIPEGYTDGIIRNSKKCFT